MLDEIGQPRRPIVRMRQQRNVAVFIRGKHGSVMGRDQMTLVLTFVSCRPVAHWVWIGEFESERETRTEKFCLKPFTDGS